MLPCDLLPGRVRRWACDAVGKLLPVSEPWLLLSRFEWLSVVMMILVCIATSYVYMHLLSRTTMLQTAAGLGVLLPAVLLAASIRIRHRAATKVVGLLV
jgi:hypothetical protein